MEETEGSPRCSSEGSPPMTGPVPAGKEEAEKASPLKESGIENMEVDIVASPPPAVRPPIQGVAKKLSADYPPGVVSQEDRSAFDELSAGILSLIGIDPPKIYSCRPSWSGDAGWESRPSRTECLMTTLIGRSTTRQRLGRDPLDEGASLTPL